MSEAPAIGDTRRAAPRTLLVIGIGAGDPRHMTVAAIEALNSADVVLIPHKGPQKDDLAELRRAICRRFLTNPATRLVGFDLPVRDAAAPYRAAVDRWHDDIAACWQTVIGREAAPGARIALLVWGDPSLYDSTLRIVARLVAGGMGLETVVVPGITAIQALTAAHGIAFNTIGGAVVITTGRRLRAEGFPPAADTAVVMLDAGMAFEGLDPDGFDIWWGAYLGTGDEILIAGPLGAVTERIRTARAAARAAKGWIMDTCLIRRRGAGDRSGPV